MDPSRNTSNEYDEGQGLVSDVTSGSSTQQHDDARDATASPSSSLGIGTMSSSENNALLYDSSALDDNISETSSIGMASSSSQHTGQVSLARRARELDQLMRSQKRTLNAFDTPGRSDTVEDDGLQTELQDLARSERLLRQELEIFASSFRRHGDLDDNASGDGDADMQMHQGEEDVSSLPETTAEDDPFGISVAMSPPVASVSPPIMYYHQQQEPSSSASTVSPPQPLPAATPKQPIYSVSSSPPTPSLMTPHLGFAATTTVNTATTPGPMSTSGMTSNSGLTTMTTSPGMAPWSPQEAGSPPSTGSAQVSPVNSSLSATPHYYLGASGGRLSAGAGGNATGSTRSSGSNRVSLDNQDYGESLVERTPQQRLHPSPALLFGSHDKAYSETTTATSPDNDDRPYDSSATMMQLPAHMMEPSASSSLPPQYPTQRRPPAPPPPYLRTTPAAPRVSLDQEVPSLLGTSTPPPRNDNTQFPSSDDRHLRLNTSEDSDSLFGDLARLSSETPRMSNARPSLPNERRSATSMIPSDHPPLPIMPVYTPAANTMTTPQPYQSDTPSPSQATTIASNYGTPDQPPVSPSLLLPTMALYSQTTPVSPDAATSPPSGHTSNSATVQSAQNLSVVEASEGLFANPYQATTDTSGDWGSSPSSPTPVLVVEEGVDDDENDEDYHMMAEVNVSREDQIGLLDDFIGESWKLPSASVSSSPASVPVGQYDNDEEQVTAPTEPLPPTANQPEGQSKRKSRTGILSAFWGAGGEGSGGAPPLLSIDTSEDGESTTEPRRKRKCRGIALLLLLVLGVVAVVVIPTSVVATRDNRNSSALIESGQNDTASDSPTDAPSFLEATTRPSLLSTLRPSSVASFSTDNPAPTTMTPSLAPTVRVSQSPSEIVVTSSPSSIPITPTFSPSSIPTTSVPTSFPSQQPTTSTPSLAPVPEPTDAPSIAPIPEPTSAPSIAPIPEPTRAPSYAPSTNQPSTSPVTLAVTFQPTLVATTQRPTTVALTELLDDEFQLGPLLLQNSVDGGEALGDVSSPQFAAYQWLLADSWLPVYSEERRIQRYAMAAIYFSLQGDSWLDNTGWLSQEHECQWFSRVNRGICSWPQPRNVRRLVLYYNNLHGTIPNEIGLLTDLQEINLMGGPDNYISGSLPESLGSLSSLQLLELSDNSLTGTLSTTFSTWTDLTLIDASNNQLGGPLEDILIGSWSNLQEVNLSSNSFNGTMPQTWSPSLQFLKLNDNQFHSELPSSLGLLQNLRILHLDHNKFTSLTTFIGSMQNLIEFSAVGNELEGPIVSELGALSNLRALHLSDNSLVGTIPSELGGLDKLVHILDLSYNLLTGTIPESIGEIDQLRRLDLSGNQLQGAIPSTMVEISRLSSIRLDNNDFTGAVPQAVCDIWNDFLTAAYADCDELDCPCCIYCCTDGEGCVCRYADDPLLEWQCI